MSNVLQLIVEDNGGKELAFEVERMLVAGRAARDQAQVRKHVEELVKEGALSPEAAKITKSPIFFPVLPNRITTGDEIEVIGDEATSGEVEYVLLVDKNAVYVSVGSDHTDRRLESHSVVWSKNICPKVLARKVWHYESVKDHWDDLILRSWVNKEGQRELYQESALAALMRPEDLMKKVKPHVQGDIRGMVLYGGTVPAIGGIYFSNHFEAELLDKKLERSIRFDYSIKPITWFKE